MIRGTFAEGVLIVAVTAAAAVAQTNPGIATQVAGFTGSVGGFAGRPLNGVTGQPFSAQEETETVQTLDDGTHITNGTQKVMHYRDSLGRTRTERTPMQPPGFMAASAPAPPIFIEIADPVGGYRYSFDSNSHTAHRSPFGPARAGKVLAPPATTASVTADPALGRRVAPASSANGVGLHGPRPEISHEQLGTRTIEGVLAEGTRTTTTYPIGFLGNDRPLTTVTETWISPEIGMAVLTKTSDPRRGESTMKLTNVSRAEPDPSLFQPPAGYEVVDPSGEPAGK
jgi:hypothetical protein